MKLLQSDGLYEFGEFRLDLRTRRLLRGNEIVSLTPKEFELLLFLVENAGRVVEKEELLEKLWADTFVEEGTLTRYVSWLRKKLADNSGGTNDRFIETLPKRGYRFLPAVTKIDDASPALIVEEETTQHITIEETITFENAESQIAPLDRQALNAGNRLSKTPVSGLLPEAKKPRRKFRLRHALALSLAGLAIINFALYQIYFRRPETKSVLPGKIAPFSGFTGREDMPAFSPDGRQMAFAWNGGEGENLDIYVKLIGTGEPIRLTNSSNDEIYPTFSPDNRHIAFVRNFPDRDEVILIPALGGAERRVCTLNSRRTSVSFSPDGKTLAVVETHSTDTQRGIFLIDLQTGERRQLTAPTEFVRDTTPRFSPDGASLAFLRSFNELKQELFVVPVSSSGGNERQLTFDETGIRSLAWNPDGRQIIFVSFRASNQSNLWQIGSEGGAPVMSGAAGKNITHIAISPDGKTVAFTEESNDSNIWQIAPGGDAPKKFIASARADHSQQISPDGSRIVFVSDRTGDNEIWLADADGKNQRQLTDTKSNAGSPRFSPDGKLVAYDAKFENTNDIFVIATDGGGMPRRLTDSQSRNNLPAWSADGRFLYFCSNRTGELNFWKMPAAGGDAVQITRRGGFESFASPDGREIYYSKANGIAGLWRVSVDGGADDESPVRELSEAGAWRYWTISPKGIYFVASAPNAPYQIRFHDFSSGQSSKIAGAEKPPLGVFPGLSVSADGKTILYAQRDQSASSIMLAESATNF